MWISTFLSTHQFLIDYCHPEILRNVVISNAAIEHVRFHAQRQHAHVKIRLFIYAYKI